MDRALLGALDPEVLIKGEDDAEVLLKAVMDCLDLTRSAGNAAFAPEVVLDFVRSITTLEEGEGTIDPTTKAKRDAAKSEQTGNKHLLDTSLEVLDCERAPVLLPLIAPRVSDPGVHSLRSWRDGMGPDSSQSGSALDAIQLSNTRDEVDAKAVIAEALNAAKQLPSRSVDASSEDTPGPSELEDLMEVCSYSATATDNSTTDGESNEKSSDNNDSTSAGSDAGDPGSTAATEMTSLVDPMIDKTPSEPNLDNVLVEIENCSIDLTGPYTPAVNPASVSLGPLYDMCSIQHGLLEDCFQPQITSGMNQISAPLPGSQPYELGQSNLFCCRNRDTTTFLHNAAWRPEALPTIFGEVPQPPKPSVNIEHLVAAHLRIDDSPFHVPFALPPFEQHLSAELCGSLPQSGLLNSGSLPPSVDEKSFINFLFSNMSSDVLNDKTNEMDECLLRLGSNTGPLQDPADNLFPSAALQETNEESFDYDTGAAQIQLDFVNSNIDGFIMSDVGGGFIDLTTIEEADQGVELAAELESYTRTQTAYTDTEEGSIVISSAEMVDHREAQESVLDSRLSEKDMHVFPVFPVQIPDNVQAFLRVFQQKTTSKCAADPAAESGLLPPDAYKVLNPFAEPERNYDILKTVPERSTLRKSTPPSSDSNQDQSPCSSGEEDFKPRRRNGRRVFFDPTISSSTRPSSRNRPIRKTRISTQRLPKLPERRDWLQKVRLPANAPTCLSEDDLDTEDVAGGLLEDTSMLKPLLDGSEDDTSLLEVTASVLTGQAVMLKNVLMRFDSSEDDQRHKASSPTPTPSSSSSTDKRALVKAVKFVDLPRCTPLYIGTEIGPEQQEESFSWSSDPQSTQALLESVLDEGAHQNLGWRAPPPSLEDDETRYDLEWPSISQAAEVDTAPMRTETGNKDVELIRFDEVHPSMVKKTPTLRNLLPKISEEQMD